MLPVVVFSVLGSVIAIIFCLMLDDMKQVIAYRRIGHIGLVVGTILMDNEMGLLRGLLIMQIFAFIHYSNFVLFCSFDKEFNINMKKSGQHLFISTTRKKKLGRQDKH